MRNLSLRFLRSPVVTLQQEIVGNAMQMAVVSLQPGQTVYCEAGKFLFKTTNVTMETRLGGPSGGGGQQAQPGGSGSGGMGGLLRQAMGTAMQAGQRALAGESLAFQYFTTQGGEGTVGFAVAVNHEGRVVRCTVRQSSGVSALDAATCKLIAERARFAPATDQSGAKKPGVYASRVRWAIRHIDP